MQRRNSASPGALRSGIPLPAFLLPFAILAAAGFALRSAADSRTWSVLGLGVVVLLILAAVGPLQRRTDDGRYSAAGVVVWRALFATMLLFSMCCAWIAAYGLDGTLDVWPGIVFLPAWLVFALLIPLWADSPAIRTEQPDTGWKSVGGYKPVYSNPDDEALWVAMRPQHVLDRYSVLYTPNLGHRWGRAAMVAFVVLLAAMVLMLIAAVRPHGLLP